MFTPARGTLGVYSGVGAAAPGASCLRATVRGWGPGRKVLGVTRDLPFHEVAA